jgi:hypothetical protein
MVGSSFSSWLPFDLTALFRLFPSTFATAISFSSDRAMLAVFPALAELLFSQR